jgi:acetyl-CoA carboxylase biotin carboxylase subunit
VKGKLAMASNSLYLPLRFAPFSKVLIANRGEIGVRIIRACRDLGLSPLAVYSTADIHSRHVSLADAAACIGPGPSAESYLSVPAILRAARELGAEAVHPGFGFLSESPAFANAVLEAGFVWIGPSPQAIHDMGDKTVAKRKVTAAGVPCAPGKNEPLKDASDLQAVASQIGYPLILKAAAGGGGRGMRVVRADAELAPAFEACVREAQSYFGNPEVFCERFIERPRHVEIQVIADGKGNTIHLFERDCTIQRRHQKLIEEAPSSFVSDSTRHAMGEVAVKAAQSVGYVNAGTVEFILESPEKYYFMEMNTRIQVEHPVTELVTGVDLLQWQLRVARGEALPWKQEQIVLRGHAMEARINAEDAYNGFRPNPGLVTRVEFPAGPGVRVDSHIYSGYRIPEFYDSMIAKLIVHGESREDAMNKMRRALGEFRLEGVETSIPYAQALMEDPRFREGDYTTRYVEENEDLLARAEKGRGPIGPEQAAAAALRVGLQQARGTSDATVPDASAGGGRLSAGESTHASEGDQGAWSWAARLEATRRIGS